MSETSILELDKIHQAIPYMKKSLADYIYDAAVFCFHHHRHQSGIRCEVQSLEETFLVVSIVWTKQFADDIKRTFGGTDYAVEFAAECIACLTIRAITEYTVIERSQRFDGVDFWLAERSDEDKLSFHRSARMESKGITEARYPSDIKAQVDKGIKQSKRSDNTLLPAYIIVTEFSTPVVVMVQR